MENKIRIALNDYKKDVLDSELPVILYFTYLNRGICDIINTRIYNVLKLYSERIEFIQLDIEQYSSLCKQLRVDELPTILIFKNGKAVTKLTGLISENELDNSIKSLLTEVEVHS